MRCRTFLLSLLGYNISTAFCHMFLKYGENFWLILCICFKRNSHELLLFQFFSVNIEYFNYFFDCFNMLGRFAIFFQHIG
jgi:hypothetical protein